MITIVKHNRSERMDFEVLFPQVGRKDPLVVERVNVPDTIQARLVKLQNRIKHMEFNIDQNRKRGELLSQDCYSLFRSTELLAFDFMFASYLMGQVPARQVYANWILLAVHPNLFFT
jgi:hypothetical protein